MKRTAYLILMVVFAGIRSLAQTVVVTDDNSVTTGDASSVLDVKSVAKGFLAPRMTESQRTSISSPATGLLVYQTNNTAGYYYYDGSAWVIIAKGVGWTASGSNIYYNTGKVGIGNTSPGEALDVTGNVKFSGALMPGNDAGTSNYLLTSAGAAAAPTWVNPGTYFESYIWKLDGNNVPALKKFGTTSNYDLPFITNNTEKMRLTSGGYLGIGVDSPAAPLHVGRSTPTSGITPIAIFEETRDAGLSNSVVMQLGNKSLTSNATKFLIGSASSQKRWIFGTDKDGNNSQNFYLWDDNSVLPRLYIEGSNGYTGLGTASPLALLHVYSHLPASGDVPAALFEGESDGGVVSMSLVNNSGARAKTAFIFGGSTTTYQWSLGNDIQGNNEHNFYIYDEGSFNTRFLIDQNGNVGIGNILPTEALDVTGNIKLSGNIIGGSWTGGIVSPAYGGTGVDNSTKTITLGGNLTTSGANNLTLTTTGATNVTLPISGTLITSGVTTLSSLASIGTITTGTWNGTVISPTYGGTGINNGTKTITLGGNLATSGANNVTLTTTGATNVTLPTSGTLVNTAVTTLSSLASVGTITTGTWNGTVISPTYGGTGINNGTKTITLGDNLTTSGAFPLTLTATATTNVTLPTSGTLVNTAVTTLSSLASIGTITTGTWNGTVVSPTYGGTGVNNGTKTITLGDNLTTSGAFPLTLTTTGSTNVTLPTSGTLVTTAVTSLASLTSAASLATVGTITSGTWNGTIVSPTYGGTGINNGTKTITLGDNLTTSGAFPLTFTTTGSTNVTLPTSGTLVNTAVTTLSSLASVGTITTGTWSGTTIAVNKGGTNLTSYTTGAMLYASAATTLAEVAPNTTATKEFLNQTSSGAPSWDAITAADVPGALINTQIFSTAGTFTYTPTTGTTKVIIVLLGGGGGGGGAASSTSNAGAGGGGGAGSLVQIDTILLGGTYSVTVGALGAGGSTAGGTGTAGSSTTFTDLAGANPTVIYTAPGGAGGIGMATGNTVLTALGGAGGTAGTGAATGTYVNGAGSPGEPGIRLSGTIGVSGNGAGTPYGGGGAGRNTTNTGGAATGFGAGGGGGFGTGNTNSRGGGNGSAGLAIIYEYR